MDWKRTKSSFVFWGFLLAVICVSAFFSLEAFCSQQGIPKNFIWPIYAGVLLLGGLFSVLISLGRRHVWPELKSGFLIWRVMELLCLACLVACGVSLRLQELTNAQAGRLYEMAMMRYQTPIPDLLHGAENLYLQMLHGICFLLGNTPYFCIRFQLVLTILAGVIWYFGIRLVSGPVVALVFSAFYFLDLDMITEVHVLSVRPFLFVIYGIGLVLIGVWLRSTKWIWLCSVLAGLWIGISGYMDILGWTLLAFVFSVHHLEKEDGNMLKRWKWIAVALTLVGSVLGFLLAGGWSDLVFGRTLGTAYGRWFSLYRLEGFITLSGFRGLFDGRMGHESLLIAILLCIMAICPFWIRKDAEKISPWTAVLLISASALFLQKENWIWGYAFGEIGLTRMCLFILAGVGIYDMLIPEVLVMREERLDTVPKAAKEPFSVRRLILEFRKGKEERKAALLSLADHPEILEQKNFIAKCYYQKMIEKIQRQKDIDKVMYALHSLSGDHVVIEDFVRDPHPEMTKEKEMPLFHHKKQEEPEQVAQEPVGKQEEPKMDAPDGTVDKQAKEQQKEQSTEQPKEQREESSSESGTGKKKKEGKKFGRPFGARKAQKSEGPKEEDTVEEQKQDLEQDKKMEDKPRMLENPLPLPKKHVTNVLDYDYEVSDDDDFDIQDV